MDRRTNTSDGSGGASPTVVTARHDDDDLTVGNGQSREIANAAAADAAPALPADDIGAARDSAFTFRRPVGTPVAPGDSPDRDEDPAAPADATIPISVARSGDAGVSKDRDLSSGGLLGGGLSGDDTPSGGETLSRVGAGPPAADPPAQSSSPEPTAVSAAAFVWNPPEPAPSSPSSPARNFLRSSTAAKDQAPPRTPAATVGPAKKAGPPNPAPAPAPAPVRATGTRPKASSKRSARQAHLIVARVEPWSVMKFSFLVSLVAFVILFVAVGVLYETLSGLGVFTSLDHVVASVTSSQDSAGVDASKWFTASRVLGYTALLGSINIVLITAMSTIGAVIYNLTSRLIGGVEVTLRETD